MYPKVKVKVRKEEEEEDAKQYALELSSLQSLKGFENLSPYESSPDESPTSTVRIPSSFISSSASEVPVSKAATITEKQIGSDKSKTDIRASSVPRPRAVLSSPDNDAMIGNKNKTSEELLSSLKNHNSCQNRHTKCKAIPGPTPAAGLTNTRRESKKAGDLRTKGRSIIADQSKRPSHQKVKTESFRSKMSSVLNMDK